MLVNLITGVGSRQTSKAQDSDPSVTSLTMFFGKKKRCQFVNLFKKQKSLAVAISMSRDLTMPIFEATNLIFIHNS